MSTTYSAGTISVGATSTTVTGAGTAWATSGIRAGDLLNAAGLSVRIASVDSNTQLTLARPWPGAALAGANYDLWLQGDDDRALAAAIRLIAALNGGTLDSLASLPGGANRLPYFTGAGVMAQTDLTAEARTLLGQTILSRSGNNLVTAAAARLTGGAVQTDQLDATDGRLLTVGAFGLGGNARAVTPAQLDLVGPSGLYQLKGVVAGVLDHGAAILHINVSANNAVQIACRLGLAQSGWQIEVPKDHNGNRLCHVATEWAAGVLTIIVTAPLWSDGLWIAGAPMDVPEGRWIDLRLHEEIASEESNL